MEKKGGRGKKKEYQLPGDSSTPGKKREDGNH